MTPARESTTSVDTLQKTLSRFMSPITARGVVQLALKRAEVSAEQVASAGVNNRLARELVSCSRLYVRDAQTAAQLQEALESAGAGGGQPKSVSPVVVEVRSEKDIVEARGHARQVADRMGFPHSEQIKISTAVSELARNIHLYAGEGRIRVQPRRGHAHVLEVVAEDEGPGISNVDEVLSGQYQSKTGLGRGLAGCKSIMDEFDIQTRAGAGTTVRAAKAC